MLAAELVLFTLMAFIGSRWCC